MLLDHHQQSKVDLQTANRLLLQGKLKKCLELLANKVTALSYLGSYANRITSLQSQLQIAQKQFYSLSITTEQYKTTETKIIQSTIALMDEISNQYTIKHSSCTTTSATQLHGVWQTLQTNFLAPNEIYFWTLLPNAQGILNQQTNSIKSEFFNWEYSEQTHIIRQYNDHSEVIGFIEWITPDRFKLTVMSILPRIMLYQRVL